MSDAFKPLPNVRFDRYIGKCPACGRNRLEAYVDGPEDDPRVVGIECEKCRRQWLLDPARADHFGEDDDRDPLHPPALDDNWWGAS